MKQPAEMTVDELNALPIFEPFGRDTYPVVDGTVTLPDGRVLRGLVGSHVHIPRQQDQLRVMSIGPDTPLVWSDNDGELWTLVNTQDGLKRRRE